MQRRGNPGVILHKYLSENFRIGSTHRPGLRPEDEAPTGQLTNEIIFGRLESS